MEKEELLNILRQNQEYISFIARERDDFSYDTDIVRYKVIRNSNNTPTVRYKYISAITDNERKVMEDTISLLADISLTEY